MTRWLVRAEQSSPPQRASRTAAQSLDQSACGMWHDEEAKEQPRCGNTYWNARSACPLGLSLLAGGQPLRRRRSCRGGWKVWRECRRGSFARSATPPVGEWPFLCLAPRTHLLPVHVSYPPKTTRYQTEVVRGRGKDRKSAAGSLRIGSEATGAADLLSAGHSPTFGLVTGSSLQLRSRPKGGSR
jgi:hypothetical protein